jgi:hypothetical protein
MGGRYAEFLYPCDVYSGVGGVPFLRSIDSHGDGCYQAYQQRHEAYFRHQRWWTFNVLMVLALPVSMKLLLMDRDDPDMFVRSLPRIEVASKIMGRGRMPTLSSDIRH